MKNGSSDKIGDQSDDHDVDILKQTKVHQSLVPFRQNWASNGGSSANYLKHFEEK